MEKPHALRRRGREPLLVEVAWEAVNQLGGIYTVLRSKVPSMVERWDNRYCLVGPYDPHAASVEFEPRTPTGPFGLAVKALQQWGFEAHYGHWLVTGKPRAVLLNPRSVYYRLMEIKYTLWEQHDIPSPPDDDMVNQVLAFGYMVSYFLRVLSERESERRSIVAHFHEWMGGAAIPEVRRQQLPIGVVFTTHATLLGRYLAMNDPWFYDHLPFVDWLGDAKRFNIETQVRLERAAAHGAHVFTTVSEVTAWECEYLLHRRPDVVLPNGLNIERFAALHEFQNLHRQYKEQIHQFVMGHFFPSYCFDLDRTIYLFTSGRYEYRNKGFDLVIESLARLNWRLRQMSDPPTVVAFIITRRPYHSINPDALRGKAVLEELRNTCESIKEQIGKQLFISTAMGRSPKLDDLVEEYWRLRLRRTLAEWRTDRYPMIVTHNIIDDAEDQILAQLRACHLLNAPEDPVKVVYHPDFVTPSNPLFGMDYDQFVRGCHMGIFPSYYEPWGYPPLECLARGIPAITSDLSGFGAYALKHLPDHEERGIMISRRRWASYDDAAQQITNWLAEHCSQGRRDRIDQRNRVESGSDHFDWHNLARYYDEAHELAMRRGSP